MNQVANITLTEKYLTFKSGRPDRSLLLPVRVELHPARDGDESSFVGRDVQVRVLHPVELEGLLEEVSALQQLQADPVFRTWVRRPLGPEGLFAYLMQACLST